MFRFAGIQLGSGGIAPCLDCGAAEKEPYSTASVLAKSSHLSKDCSLQGFQGVMFDGFEPFEHRGLVEIITESANSSFERIGIQTDGGALSSSDNTRGSIAAGVRVFEVVLTGGDARSHDKRTGVHGLFDAAVLGVENIAAVSLQLGVSATVVGVAAVCSHNITELPLIVGAFCRIGVDAIRVEVRSGGQVPQALAKQAYEIATPAGVALFGDGMTRLNGVRLYSVVEVGA